ncbi:MAG: imidazolonepropionase [Gemmatimonadaceae bacterium]|nr:imidazolonepropionase [Gemmatimonadaceae bacterium]
MTRTLWRRANIATFADGAATRTPYGFSEHGALVTEGDRIVWVGADDALPADLRIGAEHDLQGALLTPGLIDAHTHLVYGGDRAAEFEQRLHGATYAEIAKAGGGIASTVRATRAAATEQLTERAVARARVLMAEGVTTLEIKSGYGLSADDERRSLKAAREVGLRLPVSVCTTSLALHALPPEYAGQADAYVDAACDWLRDQHAAGLVDAADAFCESIAFTTDQVARWFTVARSLGLRVKLHAEQLSDSKGAVLAASFNALSCDHLEYLGADGVRAIRESGTVAMLLPGAYYFLRETQLPPIAALREAGVPIAIATDHNPGSSPALSLLLMLNMACTLFRLTPEESWRGVTVNAAKALGLDDRGMLVSGMRADLAVWDAEHPRELAYRFGVNPCRRVVIGGTECVA